MKFQLELREVPGLSNVMISREPVYIFKKTVDGMQLAHINYSCKQMKYPTVTVNSHNYRVHKLVALTFPDLVQGEPGVGKEIDHINGDKEDYRPENLRWVSHYENLNNPATRWKFHKSKKRKKINECKINENKKIELSKTVYQYTKKGILVGVYKSVGIAGKWTGIADNGISQVAMGAKSRNTAGGYIWSYVPLQAISYSVTN